MFKQDINIYFGIYYIYSTAMRSTLGAPLDFLKEICKKIIIYDLVILSIGYFVWKVKIRKYN